MDILENVTKNLGNVIEEVEKKIPNVLIIEDEEVERLTLKAALETEGFIVQTSSNGAEAESLVKNNFFDVAVVDYRLPDIDGLNLIKKIKLTAVDIVPIIVTAHSAVEVAIESMTMGTYDYISKPLDIPKLIGTIKKIVEEKEVLYRSRKELSKIVSEHNISYSSTDEQLVIITTPDSNLLSDEKMQVSFASKIKNFFVAIKNYYWGS